MGVVISKGCGGAVSSAGLRGGGFAAVLLVVCQLVGCGGDGVARYGVEGTVTYQGAPVPLGKIQIMPDRKKGNRGPMGASAIVDGRYEISPDKGAITGPVVVTISGADGKDRNIEAGRPFGNWLFQGHREEREFESGNKEIDFEIP